MVQDELHAMIAFPEWIVAVTYQQSTGYCCWVITPEWAVLTDGDRYNTSQAALAAGRSLVQYSMGQPVDFDRGRLYE